MPQLFVVLLASLVLISPAAARDLMTSDGRPVRTVAVVSQLGDGFHLVQEAGHFLSASTKDTYIPVSGWQIDERIERYIVQALGPRLIAVQMTENELEGRSTVNADTVVWVAPAADTDSFHIGDLYESLLQGLGLYRRTGTLSTGTTGVFAVYDIVIFDAKTKRELVRRRAKLEMISSHAAELVDEQLWPGDDKRPSPEQIPPIRDAITGLVDKSLERTLKNLIP